MACSSSRGPALEAAGRRLGGDQRLRVGLEEADVRAGRRDGDLDGEDLLAGQPAHHASDQRRLAVAAGRNQEHLLPGGQVAAEAVALVLAVGKRRRRDDLAVDKRVVGSAVGAAITSLYVMITQNSVIWRAVALITIGLMYASFMAVGWLAIAAPPVFSDAAQADAWNSWLRAGRCRCGWRRSR